MSATAEIPVGRLPDAWRLQVCGVTFTATVQKRRRQDGFVSALLMVRSDASLCYIPPSVVSWFQIEAAKHIGKLPVWANTWFWGRFRAERNAVRIKPDAQQLLSEVRHGLEVAAEQAEIEVNVTGEGGRR